MLDDPPAGGGATRAINLMRNELARRATEEAWAAAGLLTMAPAAVQVVVERTVEQLEPLWRAVTTPRPPGPLPEPSALPMPEPLTPDQSFRLRHGLFPYPD